MPGSHGEFARSECPRKVNIGAEARPRDLRSDHRETDQDRRVVGLQVYPDRMVEDLFSVYPDQRGEDLPQAYQVDAGPSDLTRFENISSWGGRGY